MTDAAGMTFGSEFVGGQPKQGIFCGGADAGVVYPSGDLGSDLDAGYEPTSRCPAIGGPIAVVLSARRRAPVDEPGLERRERQDGLFALAVGAHDPQRVLGSVPVLAPEDDPLA